MCCDIDYAALLLLLLLLLPLPAGPSMMPGGSAEAYQYIEDIVSKVAAQASISGLPAVSVVLANVFVAPTGWFWGRVLAEIHALRNGLWPNNK
jgi:hypothetical protein